MNGATVRSSAREAGDGKGVTCDRQLSVFRHVGQPLEYYPVTVWASQRAGRANFGLLNAFVGGTIGHRKPNGECQFKGFFAEIRTGIPTNAFERVGPIKVEKYRTLETPPFTLSQRQFSEERIARFQNADPSDHTRSSGAFALGLNQWLQTRVDTSIEVDGSTVALMYTDGSITEVSQKEGLAETLGRATSLDEARIDFIVAYSRQGTHELAVTKYDPSDAPVREQVQFANSLIKIAGIPSSTETDDIRPNDNLDQSIRGYAQIANFGSRFEMEPWAALASRK